MLEIHKIKKSYKTGDFVQHALKGVDIKFRKSEFVAILGASGSGKTTLLNILGGLDRYDAGDLLINNLSTKKFKDKDWDAYRNNCVGFIFQSYNLIGHISIVNNVEMAMTLSNVSKSTRRNKALAVLKKVGLEEHAYKKPNQLSGGQMQRVAIARALVNDPEIILADEPTGALDSKTSEQIMKLITEIAKDKLVIMVTHNKEIADEYASRVIELKDGEIIKDSKPFDKVDKDAKIKIKKTKMSFWTAMSLSFNNILTKKGRTFITSLASSIGIIGIALILSLSNGFDIQIAEFEKDTLSSLPIMIMEQAMETSPLEIANQVEAEEEGEKAHKDGEIIPMIPFEEEHLHMNTLCSEYLDYIEELDEEMINGISYIRAVGLNLVKKVNDKVISISSMGYFGTLPNNLDGTTNLEMLESDFDLLAGSLPSESNELIILIDGNNNLAVEIIEMFGLDTEENLKYDDLLGQTLKLIDNDDYYDNVGKLFFPTQDLASVYENGRTLEVVGVIRAKEGDLVYEQQQLVIYSDSLIQEVIEDSMDSAIVKAQLDSNINVMTGVAFTDDEEGVEAKEQILSYLGSDTLPMGIQIYPKDFESKEYILSELDKYNEDLPEEEQILYTDMGTMITSLSEGIMDGITIVLVAFSGISLVVSSIMIGIITYISVLERTKEIGILRSLGARKKDISRVFNAETTIIGLFSGLLGVVIAVLLLFPVNAIIYSLTDLNNVGVLNPVHALILITVSYILTIIGGAIPAKLASKKDPVEALRTE